MIEELKAYKNSYGDIFETKEEAERQEEITKVKLQLAEVNRELRETIDSAEKQKNGNRITLTYKYLEVIDLVDLPSYYHIDNEDYQLTEKIIVLIAKIINLGRLIKRLESNSLCNIDLVDK